MMEQMINFNPDNWYWQAQDGRLYSSQAQTLLEADDKNHLAWKAAGNLPTPWPRDKAAVETNEALAAVLATYGLRLYSPTLVEVKTALKARVDEAAETERLKYITAGSGQAMTYQEKMAQAVAYSKAWIEHTADEQNVGEPSGADYPLLTAGLGLDGDTLLEVAETVTFSYAQWQQIGAAIEAARLTAKATIDAAETSEAAWGIFNAVVWPNPHMPQAEAQEENT